MASGRPEELAPRPIRLAWSVDARGTMVRCNIAFCWLMRYAHEEVIDHPGTRLLRPHSREDDADIQAIHAAKQRLACGETTEERIVDQWIETRDGVIVEIPEAIMTYSPLSGIWDVVADVATTNLHDGPQFRTPFDHIRMLQYISGQTRRDMRDLSVQIEDLRTRVASFRSEDEMLADNARDIRARTRKTRSDKGSRMVPPDTFDHDLHTALSRGAATVKQVLHDTHVTHRTTLEHYLQAYWVGGQRETPLQTIRRLGRLWFPDEYLI